MKIKRNGQATPLNPQTYQQISNSLRGEKHKLFLALCWYTGERPESILSLDVSHVYQDVPRRLPRETIVYFASNRKDKKTREVHTHWALKLVLAAYNPPEKGLLFPSLYGNEEHLSRQAMDKAFRIALDKAGLRNMGFSLYSARRGFVTRLKEQGLDIKAIQALTGHKSVSSLVRYIEVSQNN